MKNKITILLIILCNTMYSLSYTEVYREILKHEIKHPEIVLKQAILETGWFKCEYCSYDHNNIFGFRYKHKYLEFDTWQESVAYYKKWQDKRYKGGDYYDFLKKVGYATSKTYNRKLKNINVNV